MSYAINQQAVSRSASFVVAPQQPGNHGQRSVFQDGTMHFTVMFGVRPYDLLTRADAAGRKIMRCIHGAYLASCEIHFFVGWRFLPICCTLHSVLPQPLKYRVLAKEYGLAMAPGGWQLLGRAVVGGGGVFCPCAGIAVDQRPHP